MKLFGKLEGGKLVYAPKNYTLEDGRIISNFNKSEALQKKYGFKEVIDTQPEYDAETQYVIIDGYSESLTTIRINFSIVAQEVEKNPLEVQVEVLTKQVQDLTNQVKELQGK